MRSIEQHFFPFLAILELLIKVFSSLLTCQKYKCYLNRTIFWKIFERIISNFQNCLEILKSVKSFGVDSNSFFPFAVVAYIRIYSYLQVLPSYFTWQNFKFCSNLVICLFED